MAASVPALDAPVHVPLARQSSTASEDSEDVVLVRLENKILMDPLSPSCENAALPESSPLDPCPEESERMASSTPPESPRTEGEATAAEATMPENLDFDPMGRMSDELEAEFEAFLKSQGEPGATPTSVSLSSLFSLQCWEKIECVLYRLGSTERNIIQGPFVSHLSHFLVYRNSRGYYSVEQEKKLWMFNRAFRPQFLLNSFLIDQAFL